MQVEDVPQDGEYLEGKKRAAYALGQDGQYTMVATAGWSAETAATRVALEAADAEIEAAWHAVHAKKKSPLWYHLKAKQLTVMMLATYASTTRLVVWWHLRPRPFAKISDAMLDRYARALRVPVAELRVLPSKPTSWL